MVSLAVCLTGLRQEVSRDADFITGVDPIIAVATALGTFDWFMVVIYGRCLAVIVVGHDASRT